MVLTLSADTSTYQDGVITVRDMTGLTHPDTLDVVFNCNLMLGRLHSVRGVLASSKV